MKRGKKGISIMIGYVLLVSAMIVMALIVFQWLKTYVPTEDLECPGDVSLSITDGTVCETNILKVEVKNTGLFNVNGYIIRGTYTDASGFEEIEELSEGYVIFENALAPNKKDDGPVGGEGDEEYPIESIEIVPVRFQEDDNGKERTVVCGDASVRKELNEICTINLEW